MSTRQEYFNQAVAGLAAQGFEQSTRNEGGIYPRCAYRGIGGRKCAIGHLIPDEVYRETMETISSIEGLRLFPPSQFEFLHELQICHDSWNTPDKMKAKLVAFAKDWGLELPQELKS